jgi:restriction endonuclease Mrr
MTFPSQDSLMDPLLVLLLLKGGADGRLKAIETYRPLASFFKLPDDERDELRVPTSKGRKWDAHVCYVREKLKVAGLLDRTAPRGIWQLTNEGRARSQSIAQSQFFQQHERGHHLGLPRRR